MHLNRMFCLLSVISLLLFVLGCLMSCSGNGDDDDDNDSGGIDDDDSTDDDTNDDADDDVNDDSINDDVDDDSVDDDTMGDDDSADDDTEGDDDDTAPSTVDCEPYGYGDAPNIIRGPYLQHVTKTTMRIMWQTDRDSNSIVRFGATEDLGFFQCDLEPVRKHEVEVEKLEADSSYFYSVRSDGVQSDTNTFATAPNEDSPFSFVVYGDNRTLPQEHALVVGGITAESPDLVLNVGDIVESGWSFWQYDQQFFNQTGDLMKTTPFYVSIGNHEDESYFYYQLFSFPGNELWYSFDYGNSRFIALNSNWNYTQGTLQYNWFENQLQTAQADQLEWLFVYCHHPAWTEGGGGTEDMRTSIVPLMELYGVDAWFSGHVHDYERGELNGVTHVITGGGGASLSGWSHDIDFITVYESRHHFVKVEITGTSATFSAIDPAGTVFDTFTLDH
jgi:Calcineurin-like phosphoesterase/Purple acid Phosphatase, N-terminal domain